MRLSKNLNLNVHGARGLFAFAVFIYHVINSGLPTYAAQNGSWIETYLLYSLKFGVELFFGISGVVIVGALVRAPSIRAFMWDRATRIYPVLWISLLAITGMALLFGLWRPSLIGWLLNFAAPPPFIHIPQINPAAWSLGYEITFYAICAAAWYLRSKGVRWWLAAAIVVGAVLLAYFPRAILMVAGVVIAANLIPQGLRRRLGAAPLLCLLAFLLCWRAIELGSGGYMIELTPAHLPFAQWVMILPLLLGAGLLGGMALLGIVDGRGWLSMMLRTRPMLWLGTVSYSFYLWHPVVMAGVKATMQKSGLVAMAGEHSQLLFALLSLPPTLIVAHFSQVYLEERLTRWLRRRGPEKGAAHAPVTASVEFTEDGQVVLDRAG